MSQSYVVKQMVNAMAYTIELWMQLGGLLSTQEGRVSRRSSDNCCLLDLGTPSTHGKYTYLYVSPLLNYYKNGVLH